MRTGRIVTLAVLALMLSGCLYGPVSNKGGISFNNATYVVEIWASTSCAHRGERLHLRGTLTNNSSESRVFQLKDKPVLDIGITLGDIKAHWSDGKSLTPDLTRLELKPGESKTIEMDFIVPQSGVSGNAGSIFTYGNAAGDVTGATVFINVDPNCPVIGP